MDKFIVLYHTPVRSELMKEFLDLIWWFLPFIRDIGGIKDKNTFLASETNQTYYLMSEVTGDKETFCRGLTEKLKTVDLKGQFVVFFVA